ncbi:hypothetical protein GH839_18445 [Bacillus thuringiensis]|nr:pentapeptide repeat protein [Bacillus cereus NVH0597-99]MRB22844.1 hypothetical protein [Bacillus thuringiensis]OOZ94617.1 hypothetical protein BHL27_28005 [Bacillus cereus]
MNENDRIRVMEILNQSQYNDEIIDGLDMSNLEEIHIADCRFGEADFSKANMKYAKINISSCFETCFDEVDFSYGELVGTVLNDVNIK